MTGLQKAVAIIVLAVIAVGWFNWRMWRRFRLASAQRAGWTVADFDAMLVGAGVSPLVAEKVRDLIQSFYGKGVAPHPDDDFRAFLAVDETEIADIAATGCEELGFERPEADAIPPLHDLRDLALYLQSVVTMHWSA